MRAKHKDVEAFERRLRNYEGIRARIAQGSLTGRNADATQGSLDFNMRELRDLIRTSDEVTDALDARPGLAGRWRRAERQHVGLPVERVMRPGDTSPVDDALERRERNA